MDFVKFFHNWFFNDYQDVVTWIMYGGAAWTVVIFVFNVIFSIILFFPWSTFVLCSSLLAGSWTLLFFFSC